MRRPRAGFADLPRGGAGAPPGGTTTPCEELADEGRECPESATRRRKQDAACGAPTGATHRKRCVTHQRWPRRWRATSLALGEGTKWDYGLPGAAKNTCGGALANRPPFIRKARNDDRNIDRYDSRMTRAHNRYPTPPSRRGRCTTGPAASGLPSMSRSISNGFPSATGSVPSSRPAGRSRMFSITLGAITATGLACSASPRCSPS